MQLVLFLLFNFIICNTGAMYYTSQKRAVVRQAVAHNDVDSFTECLTNMLGDCLIDYEFRTDPELCIKPLQKVFNDIARNPNFLKIFLDILVQYSSILEQGSFFLHEALLKGYKKLKIPSWIEKVASQAGEDPTCITVLIEFAIGLKQQSPRLESHVQTAFKDALQQALLAQNLHCAAMFVEQGVLVQDVEAKIKYEFSFDVLSSPTPEKLHFCVHNNALDAHQWKEFAFRPEGLKLLRSLYSLSELEKLLGIRTLFSCIVKNNDIPAAYELVPPIFLKEFTDDIESAAAQVTQELNGSSSLDIDELQANQALLQEIRTIGSVWLCKATGHGFYELADLLIAAGANIEEAFQLADYFSMRVKEKDLPTSIQSLLPMALDVGLSLEDDHYYQYLHNWHSGKVQSYLSVHLPAEQVFKALSQYYEWEKRVIYYHIRINTRQQKEEFIQYLEVYSTNNRIAAQLLTHRISHMIIAQNNSWYTVYQQRMVSLLYPTPLLELFLAIFWHENDAFHSLFERVKNRDCGFKEINWALRVSNAEAGWVWKCSFFEWAVVCRNFSLARDLFLLGVCEKSVPKLRDLLNQYWNPKDIDEFMRFVDGVQELQSFVP